MGLMEEIHLSIRSLVLPAGACIIGGVIGGLIAKQFIKSSESEDKLPEKWTKVGDIKELLIYPVKGMPGISVKEASMGRLGLKGVENPLMRDRVFVIVDKEGDFVSLKKLPKLTLTEINMEGGKVILSHPEDHLSSVVTFKIPTSTSADTFVKQITLWGESLQGTDCGDEVATWLDRWSGKSGLRLIYHQEDESQRDIHQRNLQYHTYRKNHTGAFHDDTPYMLMTDESVQAVNAHLENPVSQTNFRPTVVVNGLSEPFAEDFWGYIRIGDKSTSPVLKASRPCIRCIITTIDPPTGTLRTDGEPLKTIYKLKRPVGDSKIGKIVEKSAVLGAHFGIFEGTDKVIRVGDPVYAALV